MHASVSCQTAFLTRPYHQRMFVLSILSYLLQFLHHYMYFLCARPHVRCSKSPFHAREGIGGHTLDVALLDDNFSCSAFE